VVAEAAHCPSCCEPTVEHIPVRLSQNDAMTFRELFERKKRLDTGVGLCTILIGYGGITWVVLLNISLKVRLTYLVIPIIAVFAILFIHELLSAIRCPRCEAKLHQFDQNICYCPFCSVDIELEIVRKSLKRTEFLKEECDQRGLEVNKQAIQVPSK
jgi:hypothetical protein